MTQTQKAKLKSLTLENLTADSACSAVMAWITPIIDAEDPDLVNKLIENEPDWWQWAANNGYDVYSTLSDDLKEKHNVCRSSSNSGYGGSSSNFGYRGSSSNSGDYGSSSNSGYGGSSSNFGYGGSSSNSGDYGSSSNSGYGGSSSNFGYGGSSSNSGDYGSSSNSGEYGSSSNSGYYGSSSNSGYYGSSSNSGEYGSSSNSGYGGIAAGFGSNSKVSGFENSCLCCTWWDTAANRPRLKVGYVGEDLESNVWYTVSASGEWVKGEAVEVSA